MTTDEQELPDEEFFRALEALLDEFEGKAIRDSLKPTEAPVASARTTTNQKERMERLTHLTGILQPGAEPYSHSTVIKATVTVDTTAILLEELDKLGDPLPIPVSTHGFARISDDVARVLDERGQSRYTEAQWRSALREIFKRLTDDKGDIHKRSPNVANRKDQMTTITGRDLLAARADEILEADGNYDPTEPQYLAALEAAQAEIPEEAKTAVYTGDDGGETLHLGTMKVLADRGKRFDYTQADYLSAAQEAAGILSIDLSGRGN